MGVGPVKNLLPHKQQAPTMSSPLKSRASQKFRANHPYQHQMFADLVKSAKLTKSKFLFQREDEEMNSEMSNMLRNQEIVQLRPEDLPHSKLRKRSLKLKSVSWRKSLCDVCPSSEISQQKLTNLHRQQQPCTPDNKHLSGLQQLDVSSSDLCLPDLNPCQEYLPLLCSASCQNLPSYSELPSLESSPGDYSYPESLSHESSSPGSSSSESSSPSRTISLSKTERCLKFSFFTSCDANIGRQW